MRRTLLAFTAAVPLALALGVVAIPAQASTYVPVSAANGQIVPGHYIVTLKSGNGHGVTAAAGITPQHVYTGALNGFAAKLTDGQLRALQRNPNVAMIEPDQVVHALATQSPVPSWGIDRIDQRTLPLNNAYTYTNTASTVTAYVIDTGIRTTHSTFGGRAVWGTNTTGDGNNTDCNGHGTHVAGTIGGSQYGVAKAVRLVAVKVLNCGGSGTWSGVIAGIDWVRLNSPGESVANMSLGGGFNSAVNTATANLSNSGVLVAVAAGNSAANACNSSPAGTSQAVTVAASDRTDRSASFTNFGSCVDVYAPGVSITSAWSTTNTATNTISGTSMASPHVAGVAALYKASVAGDPSSATVHAWIVNNATTGRIIGAPTGTPNRLLFKSTL